MGKIVARNKPCPDTQGCGSSDAYQIYDDGTGYCFSCSKYFGKKWRNKITEDIEDVTPKGNAALLEEIKTYQIRGFSERKIKKSVCEFFSVRVAYNSEGEISEHFYPYPHGFKQRILPKTFFFIGKADGLFGKDLFPGGGKRLIITEGEIDALSVAQASMDRYQKVYPVISLRSASTTKDLLTERAWIRSFQEVVLWLDEDDPGKEATQKALKIIGYDKCKVVKAVPGCKDANDVLINHGSEKVNQCIWDAEAFTPSGIISKEDLWNALAEYNSIQSVPYPECISGLNTKLKGMRKGEIVLFISGSGAGKSSMFREIIYHLKETVEDKIGILSLEESPQETARKLSAMPLERNPSEEEIPLEELKVGFDKVFGDDRIILLDHNGETGDTSIIEYIEYMALAGAGYIFLDHITLATQEDSGSDDANTATDNMMSSLLKIVKRYPVCIGVISHLRKSPNGKKSYEEGQMPNIDSIKGSGSIKQISFDIVAFARNTTAADENIRNTSKICVLKSRYSGLTGPVRGTFYNRKTGRLSLAPMEAEFEQISTTTVEAGTENNNNEY